MCSTSTLQYNTTSTLLTYTLLPLLHYTTLQGHDFRPSYRKLKDVRDVYFPGTPVLALTATATHAVTDDISNILRLRTPLGKERCNDIWAIY